MRSCLMLLADGARADVFERLLALGALPNIQRHVIDRGSYRRATSVFTTTTGPAHLPLLTGCFPGTANVTGYRWFDRAAYRPGLPPGPWCLRSYTGPEAMWLNRDVERSVRTIYDLTRDPVNVFGVFNRGVRRRGDLWRVRKVGVWLHSHFRGDYDSADTAAAAALLEAVERGPEFAFVAFPGVDWNSHYISPFGPETEAAYHRFDDAVGDATGALQRAGRYESTLLVVCSDHGHRPVRHHFDLAVALEEERGVRVAYHTPRVRIRHPEAIACVSGNGMAQVYVVDRERPHAAVDRDGVDAALPGVREWLLCEPAVDIIVTRAGSELFIESRRGAAMLSEVHGRLRYRVLGDDPFGLDALPEEMSPDESLAATADTPYPDCLLQVAQLFRSPRCGDLVISASPDHDLRDRHEHPEHASGHGALYADHMTVPLATSATLADGALRTADLFATVLSWLQRPLPSGIDGVSRLGSVGPGAGVASGGGRLRRASATPP